MAYTVSGDNDINAFDNDDLKELTKAGMGTAAREVVVNLDLIVLLLIGVFVISIIAVFVAKSKGLLGTGK